MARLPSKDPGPFGSWLRAKRNSLNLNRQQFVELILKQTGFSISASYIKGIELGYLTISKNSLRILERMPELELGSYGEKTSDGYGLRMHSLWMEDCDIETNQQMLRYGIERGVISSRYSPWALSNNGYHLYVKSQTDVGLQSDCIESRDKVFQNLRTELVRQEKNHQIDIISLSIGFGWSEFELADLLMASIEEANIRLFIVSNSMNILNTSRKKQMASLHAKSSMALYTVMGHHESLGLYRESALFAPTRTRIILLPSVTANHDEDLQLWRNISSFATSGDYLIVDIGISFGHHHEWKQSDPRLNGSLTEGSDDGIQMSIVNGLKDFMPGTNVISSETQIETPNPMLSLAEYFVSHYTTLTTDGYAKKRILDIKFTRYETNRLAKYLEAYRWQLLGEWVSGYDIKPSYPFKLLLFRRY